MIAVRTLLSRPTAAVALAVLILVAVVTALGSVLAPSDPLAQDTSQVLAAPSAAHWLGTDYLGRDILSRLLAGTRLSVLAALEAVVIALLLGTVSAVASVFAPRGIRWVLERVFDSFMALPFITFAVAIGALLGNSIHAAMVAVGILASPTFSGWSGLSSSRSRIPSTWMPRDCSAFRFPSSYWPTWCRGSCRCCW